jgi:hypothetical protein
LTRSVTTHDPEWSPWDRAVALGVAEERALLCDGCGKPRDETMADENLGPVPDYHAEGWRCRACHAKAAVAAEFAGREERDPLAGMYFAVTRNGTS